MKDLVELHINTIKEIYCKLQKRNIHILSCEEFFSRNYLEELCKEKIIGTLKIPIDYGEYRAIFCFKLDFTVRLKFIVPSEKAAQKDTYFWSDPIAISKFDDNYYEVIKLFFTGNIKNEKELNSIIQN